MHSIRTKLTIITIIAVLVSVATIGLISVRSFERTGGRDADEKIRLICENRAMMLDDYLRSIRQSVDTVSRIALGNLDTVTLVENGAVGCSGSAAQYGVKKREAAQQGALDRYLEQHIKEVKAGFEAVANYTYGVGTYYYCLNPEISEEEPGFFYSRLRTSDFTEISLPSASSYTPEKPGPAEFFYRTLAYGRPFWMEPYENETVGERIISYLVPLYKAGSFIGVIGMDISFETLEDLAKDIEVYKTGYAALLNDDLRFLYHPRASVGTALKDVNQSLGEAFEDADLEEEGTVTIRYRAEKVEREMAFTELQNGMKLAVVAPISEVNADLIRLRTTILLTAFLILLVFTVLVSLWVKRITEPLGQLSVAARLLAAGKYDVELEYKGSDEVGILTDSFRRMRAQLQEYIGDLRGQAYTDALTRVRNKRAFDQKMQQIAGEIISGEAEKKGLAILMFDCNFLKQINDCHGHEKGDIYLQTACRMICRTFVHSPVYRIGGDEFAAVLQNEDYEDKELLVGEFNGRCAEQNAAVEEPWRKVDISMGIAVYDPMTDFSAEDIFRRADANMYEVKQRYKESLSGAPGSN